MRKVGGILTIIGGGLFGIRIGISLIVGIVTGFDFFGRSRMKRCLTLSQ